MSDRGIETAISEFFKNCIEAPCRVVFFFFVCGGIWSAFSAVWWLGVFCVVFPPALISEEKPHAGRQIGVFLLGFAGSAFLLTWGEINLFERLLHWIYRV